MLQQVGGRLLGKGSYACTFSPVPSCDTGGHAGGGTVAKVSVQDMTAEVATGRTLMSLHGGRDYFALPMTSCKPRMPIADPDASKCHVLKKNKPLTMAAMPDAGMSLTAWFHSLDRARAAASLQAVLVHVLRGMVIYQRSGFVHNDIHGGNIMVGEDGLARYIDFGQGFRPAMLRSWEDLNLGRRFAAEYVWLAPEIHAFRILGDSTAVNRLYSKIPEFKQLETAYPDRKGFRKSMEEFQIASDHVAYMRRHAFKIDWWRLGITLWHLWRRIRKGHEGTPMDRVIGGLTEFDPARRMSPRAALSVLGGSGTRRLTRRASRRSSVKARRS